MKKKRMTIDMPEKKHIEIKILASSRGQCIREFVDEALSDFINKLRRKSKKNS